MWCDILKVYNPAKVALEMAYEKMGYDLDGMDVYEFEKLYRLLLSVKLKREKERSPVLRIEKHLRKLFSIIKRLLTKRENNEHNK